MGIVKLGPADGAYPAFLQDHLGDCAPQAIMALGDPGILSRRKLALFCSVRCPGKLILQTYDLAHKLRHAGVTVIGGFHSPMERECLAVLLRSPNPIIVCPARAIDGMRVPLERRKPLEDGRLLFLSPFAEKPRRATVEMAMIRNRFVAALADRVFVAHAEPSSKTEQFCREVTSWGKPLYTLDDEANANLVALGAKAVGVDGVGEWV